MTYSLQPDALVEERIVWCENPADKQQLADAAHFYTAFYEWAKRKGIPTLIVKESSDVPEELIKAALGDDKQGKRLFERKQLYARVS